MLGNELGTPLMLVGIIAVLAVALIIMGICLYDKVLAVKLEELKVRNLHLILERLSTTREVAVHLNISVATVIRLAKKGQIPAAIVGRQYRFRLCDILEKLRPDLKGRV